MENNRITYQQPSIEVVEIEVQESIMTFSANAVDSPDVDTSGRGDNSNFWGS